MQNILPTATEQTDPLHKWHWKRHLIGSCCILFLFFLSGSQSIAASSAASTTVNRLQIQLQTPKPGPIISVDDASLASHLYRKMYQLPAYPAGRTCEEFRQGDVYTLTFYHNERIITRANVEKNGCHGLTLSKWDTRQPDQAFWDLFQQAAAYPQHHR